MKTLSVILLIGFVLFNLPILAHVWHRSKADIRAWWKARSNLCLYLLTMIGTYLLIATVILLTFFGLVATTP